MKFNGGSLRGVFLFKNESLQACAGNANASPIVNIVTVALLNWPTSSWSELILATHDCRALLMCSSLEGGTRHLVQVAQVRTLRGVFVRNT